jgi:hypothetical protein
MADEGQQRQEAPAEETAIRGSAWMAIQQGAQVVGELGGGIGGIAAAVHVAKQSKGSSDQSGGGSGPGPQSSAGSDSKQ